MTRTAEITLEDVSFRYGPEEATVIDHANWRIKPGAFAVVAGGTGSGKSTLLRSINGLVPHFSGGQFRGSVTTAGIDPLATPTRQMASRVGMVFQDPDASSAVGMVEDEIAFGMEQLGMPPGMMRTRVEELIDLLGLDAVRARPVSTLSGGERQRVSIAAAMAPGAEILVLDEPTSQLDPAGAEDVMLALRRLNEDFGTTIVLSEHRLERVASFADQFRYQRRDGVIEGTPMEVLEALDPDDVPPLIRVGRALGWHPLPLTIRDARHHLTLPLAHRALIGSRLAHGTPTMLDIRNLQVGFEGRQILADVTFSAHAGETVALIGRNGTGKTTLMRAIMGLHPLTAGTITDGLPDHQPSNSGLRLAGYLPQRARSLLFLESVEDELRSVTLQPGPFAMNFDAVVDEFELGHLLQRHPFDLSVGEQERLALALTFAPGHQILLLDEPTRGMDYRHKRKLGRLIRNRREAGGTILLATHDVDLVAEVADRVIVLGRGGMLEDGIPAEVLGGSMTFSPQLNRVFGGSVLTEAEALAIAGPGGSVQERDATRA